MLLLLLSNLCFTYEGFSSSCNLKGRVKSITVNMLLCTRFSQTLVFEVYGLYLESYVYPINYSH